MSKRYSMVNLGLNSLVGREITKAEINDEKDLVVLRTTAGDLFLKWNGDCCAHCYLANVSGSENLVGSKILELYDQEWITEVNDEENYNVEESMGTRIKTTKGYVELESRVEHNGYYGGSIDVTTDEPMDQYCSPTYDELPPLKPLEDF